MKKQKLGLKKLYQQLDKILLLFFIIFVIMEIIWIPLTSFLADLLLSQSGFQYLSYTNVIAIFTSNPIIALSFILLFVANLFMSYLQLGSIFIGIRQLLEEETPSMRSFLKQTIKKSMDLIKHFHLTKALFILLYAGILFPFMRELLKIHYLNKILLPEFIQTYILNKTWLGITLIALYLLMLYLAVRWIYALPQLLFEGKSVREAINYSWQTTKNRFFRLAWSVLWILIKAGFFFTFWSLFILFSQSLADFLPSLGSFVFAIVHFVLINFLYYMAIIYFMVRFISLVTEKELPDFAKRRTNAWMRYLILSMSCLIFATKGILTISQPPEKAPLIISHRGVSEENGVQNTIPALEKTVKLKPDFVEMDVQETKDGQFVMMHDPNLKDLAGVKAKPQDLTLSELTRLTVTENGQSAAIPSFNDYLKRADELGQKLLIEIKTSSKDSPNMMQRFLKMYGPTIIAKGHQMHSLDYKVVESVHRYSKKIPVFFILPYNTIFPQTQATGYTMEFSTLDDNFMLD